MLHEFDAIRHLKKFTQVFDACANERVLHAAHNLINYELEWHKRYGNLEIPPEDPVYTELQCLIVAAVFPPFKPRDIKYLYTQEPNDASRAN